MPIGKVTIVGEVEIETFFFRLFGPGPSSYGDFCCFVWSNSRGVVAMYCWPQALIRASSFIRFSFTPYMYLDLIVINWSDLM